MADISFRLCLPLNSKRKDSDCKGVCFHDEVPPAMTVTMFRSKIKGEKKNDVVIPMIIKDVIRKKKE